MPHRAEILPLAQKLNSRSYEYNLLLKATVALTFQPFEESFHHRFAPRLHQNSTACYEIMEPNVETPHLSVSRSTEVLLSKEEQTISKC